MNTYASSYIQRYPGKFINGEDKDKKRKYIKACLHQFHHFPPLISLVYSMLGAEAEAKLKRLLGRFSAKWYQPYSQMCGYVKIRVSTTLSWSTHCYINGLRLPKIWISVHHLQWEDGAVLHLYQWCRKVKQNKLLRRKIHKMILMYNGYFVRPWSACQIPDLNKLNTSMFVHHRNW